MAELIALVNENDEVIGYEEKTKVHASSILHRAFSVFIFNHKRNMILLQKRAMNKYHSGGLWSNACCSHLRKGETMSDALHRCMHDELCLNIPNIRIISDSSDMSGCNDICAAGKFTYFAQFDDLAEHEIDSVFVYLCDDVGYNEAEISEMKWVSIDELQLLLAQTPNIFTKWFADAYTIASSVVHLSNK